MDSRAIVNEISTFVNNYPEKTATKTRWKKPLVGFGAAGDPLFLRLKDVVRPSHASPAELLATSKTAVAFFLPFDNSIQKANLREDSYPARSWAVAYAETNRLIRHLGGHLKSLLETAGYRTVLIPPTHNYDPIALMSDWSHRHIAFIAGLGRFGLNHWLITEKGCCGRLGSLVTEASFPPTLRPEKEFCLHFAGYPCSACIDQCIYQALFPDHFDRHACNRQLLKNVAYFSDLETADVCGKCGCGLPCSTTNPMSKRTQKPQHQG